MIYQKPEIANLGVAAAVIQGIDKNGSEAPDMSLKETTTNAYEADE
jgi:hypothetical protein